MEEQRTKILFVEDDKTDQLAFERTVRGDELPYDYIIAGSVSEGRKVLRSESFDVVLIDYMLGDGTAFDLFGEVDTDIPIVIVTGSGDEEIAIQAMKAGALDYLIKDPDNGYLKILPITIANAIKSKKQEIELREYHERLEKMIEEQKQAEKDLRRINKAVESSSDAIGMSDPQGKHFYQNKAFTDLFEWTAEELDAGGGGPAAYVDQNIVREVFETVMNGKSWVGELEMVNKSGRKFPVFLRSDAIKDDVGEIIGFIGVHTDISERKQAKEEKEKLQAQLQQAEKMKAIGTLAGGVAHDLNNVLCGVVSYPELLLMRLPEDSPLRKPILAIQKTGKKAAAIVDDLLTLARRGVVTSNVVNLNDIISEHLRSPEHEKLKAFHPDVEIETNLKAGLLSILGSPVHLSNTVMNLVSNASEAMPDGGKVSISTESRYIERPISGYENVEEGDYVILTVSDTGTGISQEDIDRIFEPFYTKKKMGKSGTGLGMAVVWGTIKDHKGYIDVQSTVGKGTTFTLYFPVTRREPAKDQVGLSIEDYMGRGESILVVDDVKEQREIASMMLSELGFSVTVVSSGEEAIEYLQTNSVDLLLLDMIMDPGMDGLDAYKKILETHPDQKAIIASGFSETARVKEAQKLGAGQYLRKPYTLEKIGMVVRKELDKE